MELERLYPDRAPVSPRELLAGLDLRSQAPQERPYVVLNMVASIDGRATIAGRTAALGGEGDKALFHALRGQADAVMAGAGTVRIERYGRLVRDPERRAAREAAGLAPDPLAVVVSGSGELSPDLPLLAAAEQRVIVATAAEKTFDDAVAQVTVERTGDDLPLLLARLRSEHDVRLLLCEGGPTLNGHLLAAGLVDELFLTVSPVLLAGEDPLTIVRGPQLPVPPELELVSLLRGNGDLLLRLRVRR